MDSRIYVAFRFHANLYHSYRADTMDEKGIGKDIRIMRYCLDTLDRLNAEGINAKGTWDIENYYSLQNNMAKFCPDIIERIKGRVQKNIDEVEIMNYDNGIITAHTAREAELAIKYAISNEDGSGLKDIFGSYAPIIRPQENMMTPALIDIYNKLGIEAISIYYSAIPFNGFGSFVPKLKTFERCNVLWYTAPGFDKIKVLPSVNPADIMDKFGMKNYIRHLRREQLKMEEPRDFLLLLDMDADDDFWHGYINVKLSSALNKKPGENMGLYRYAKMLSKLPYVKFCTPYEYLKSHEPAGTVSVSEDTADGAYDSYCSWSDKLENTRLWTVYDRSRLTSCYAESLCGSADIKDMIKASLKKRILVSSTTHFGLSTPVMCRPRLIKAYDMALEVQKTADNILSEAKKRCPIGNKVMAVFNKEYIDPERRQTGLIRLKTDRKLSCDGALGCIRRSVFGKSETDIIYSGPAENLLLSSGDIAPGDDIYIDENSISNGILTLKSTLDGLELYKNGRLVTDKGCFETTIKYNGKMAESAERSVIIKKYPGYAALTLSGRLALDKNGAEAVYSKVFTLISGYPYLIADVDISYPKTSDYGTEPKKVQALYRTYDMRWNELCPMEIIPRFKGSSEEPIRVYKHNFMASDTSFSLDYYKYTKNKDIDSANNSISCGYVAFARSGEGVLVSQSSFAQNNFAFMKTRFKRKGDSDEVRLNPMGVYAGRQRRYNLSKYGVGTMIAKLSGAGYLSSAPTFRGGHQQFSLMLAFYEGGAPDGELKNDALLFAFPPYIYSGDEKVSGPDMPD